MPFVECLVDVLKRPAMVRAKPPVNKSQPQTEPANRTAPRKIPVGFWVSCGGLPGPKTDNYVVVAYQNLMEEHGLSLEDALAVSNAAKDILTRRWPKARILGSDEGFAWMEGDAFIWLEYESRIPMKDFDQKNWDTGARPRPGLQEMIKEQAAKLAGVSLPPSLPWVEL